MKRSFLSRLTGSSDDFTDFAADSASGRAVFSGEDAPSNNALDESGELSLDIFQTPEAIVVKALVGGVLPSSIDIALTREMLTISGKREEETEVEDDNYFRRELYWGAFSRTIMLPEEIDVDLAEATEKHGILIIRQPKINKKREMKLKVRAR